MWFYQYLESKNNAISEKKNSHWITIAVTLTHTPNISKTKKNIQFSIWISYHIFNFQRYTQNQYLYLIKRIYNQKLLLLFIVITNKKDTNTHTHTWYLNNNYFILVLKLLLLLEWNRVNWTLNYRLFRVLLKSPAAIPSFFSQATSAPKEEVYLVCYLN